MSLIKHLIAEISRGKENALAERLKRNISSHVSFFKRYSGDKLNEVIQFLEEYVDPTKKGIYLNWLVDLVSRENIFEDAVKKGSSLVKGVMASGGYKSVDEIPDKELNHHLNYYIQSVKNQYEEDAQKLKDILKIFHENKADIKREGYSININDYSSVGELNDLVNKFGDSKPDPVEDENVLIDNKYFINNDHADVVIDSNNIYAVNIKSLEASQFYGCYSNWCTTYSNNFNRYTKDGLLIIFIRKDNINNKEREWRRSQMYLPYTTIDREYAEWRDMYDALMYDDIIHGMKDFFEPEDIDQIYDYLKTNNKFEFHDTEKDISIKRSGGTNKYGFFVNDKGNLAYISRFPAHREIPDFIKLDNDINDEFIESILRGEYWGAVYSDYGEEFFDDLYKYVELNEWNKKFIYLFLNKMIDEGEVDLNLEDQDEEFSEDNILDFLIDYKSDDIVSDIKSIMVNVYNEVNERAMADKYYKLIMDHFKTEWQVEGDIQYDPFEFHTNIPIHSNENDTHKKLIKIFGSENIIDKTVEGIDEEMDKLYFPDQVYGDIKDEYLNEILSYKLEDEFHDDYEEFKNELSR